MSNATAAFFDPPSTFVVTFRFFGRLSGKVRGPPAQPVKAIASTAAALLRTFIARAPSSDPGSRARHRLPTRGWLPLPPRRWRNRSRLAPYLCPRPGHNALRMFDLKVKLRLVPGDKDGRFAHRINSRQGTEADRRRLGRGQLEIQALGRFFLERTRHFGKGTLHLERFNFAQAVLPDRVPVLLRRHRITAASRER